MLFAAAEEGAGWAVVATLVSLILTFLVTMRRDRMKSDTEAVAQWKDLATNAVRDRDAAIKERNQLYRYVGKLQEQVRYLQGEIRALKGD